MLPKDNVEIQLTTSSTDFFVVAQMSVDLVGFVKLVSARCGRDELEDMDCIAHCNMPAALSGPLVIPFILNNAFNEL